jgi:hypothetical protein
MSHDQFAHEFELTFKPVLSFTTNAGLWLSPFLARASVHAVHTMMALILGAVISPFGRHSMQYDWRNSTLILPVLRAVLEFHTVTARCLAMFEISEFHWVVLPPDAVPSIRPLLSGVLPCLS